MLEKLKEYKELIAIIVFFLGGFAWLNMEFPKKSDLNNEIGTLNCLLDKYMMLTQLQIRSHDLEKDIEVLKARIPNPRSSGASGTDSFLSPAMRIELDQLTARLKSRIRDLEANTTEMEKISDELARHTCKKVAK